MLIAAYRILLFSLTSEIVVEFVEEGLMFGNLFNLRFYFAWGLRISVLFVSFFVVYKHDPQM
jgi:hypothetical protein